MKTTLKEQYETLLKSEIYKDIQRSSHLTYNDIIGKIRIENEERILQSIQNNGTWDSNGFINVIIVTTGDYNEVYFSLSELLSMTKNEDGSYLLKEQEEYIEITLLAPIS